MQRKEDGERRQGRRVFSRLEDDEKMRVIANNKVKLCNAANVM